VTGLPAQFGADAHGVDGVAAVVAGAVGPRCDQAAVGRPRRQQRIEGTADRLHHLLVGALPMAAHAVAAAQLTPAGRQQQGIHVVLHIQPVAHVLAVAIKRNRLTGSRLEDHDGDQLLGELRAEKELEKEINALMRKAEILDAQEDRRYGKGKLGSELPDELRRRQDRLARIRQARKEMEAETAAAAARQRQEHAEEAQTEAVSARDADAPADEQIELNRKAEAAAAKAKVTREKSNEAAEDAGLQPPDLEPLACDAMPRRGLVRKADGTPTKKTQRNFTDADSHLIQSGGSYLQGYNCQLAVDSDHQVIVAVGVSNQPPDVEHLEPMLQRIAATAGALPKVMSLDAGYWSEDNAKACTDQGIDAYIATGRLPHGQPPPPQRGPLPRDADAKTRMARKLRSKKGSAIYAQRKAIVEPVNGQIKEGRGLRRFLLRGLEKVDGEWHLIAATHNLLKLFRFRRSQQQMLMEASG